MPRSLSAHFTVEELVFSQTAARKGIDNTPSAEIVDNLRTLAATLEQVREALGAPILISSGYRSLALNRAVRGAAHSAHMLGLAADFTAPAAGSVLQVARKLAASGIAYDKLIHEYGSWVHLGLAEEGVAMERKQLSIFQGTGYIEGIVSKPA
jgi:hypothetical protein